MKMFEQHLGGADPSGTNITSGWMLLLGPLFLLTVWAPTTEAQWLPDPAPWEEEAQSATASTVIPASGGETLRTVPMRIQPTLAPATDPARDRSPFIHVLGGAALGAAVGSGTGFVLGAGPHEAWAGGALGAGAGAHFASHREGSLLLPIGGAALSGYLMVLPVMAAYWEGSPDAATQAMLVGGFALTQGGGAALVERLSRSIE